MTLTNEPLAADAAVDSVAVPLRQRTMGGFVWVIVSVVSSKFIGFAAQLVLARYLTRDDFGLVALALAASTFVLLLRESGVTQVLVQRGPRFDDWAGPGLGLVGTLSIATGLLLAALAHPLARWYHDARLVPMLYVLAMTCPLAGFANVAVARLEHDLRFRALGLVVTGVTLTQYVVQTLLAVGGMGAMSFVWGIFISNVLRLAWLWTLCRPDARRLWDVRAWAGLLKDSAWLLGSGVFAAVVSQYDRIILGRATDLATVGLYFFAFNLTTQTSQILSTTLGNVLFPALSQLSDRPERQRAAFVEASRLLACVAMPLCLLQAVLARPLLRAFGPQWDAAVPLLQVLSVGMAFAVCAAPAVALMQAQGRFRTQFYAQIVFTSCYLLLITLVARSATHAALSVAIAVTMYSAVFGPVGVQLGVSDWKFPWPASRAIFLPGVVLSITGVAAGELTHAALGDTLLGWSAAGAAYVAAGTAVFVGVYRAEGRHMAGLVRSVLRRSPAAAPSGDAA